MRGQYGANAASHSPRSAATTRRTAARGSPAKIAGTDPWTASRSRWNVVVRMRLSTASSSSRRVRGDTGRGLRKSGVHSRSSISAAQRLVVETGAGGLRLSQPGKLQRVAGGLVDRSQGQPELAQRG